MEETALDGIGPDFTVTYDPALVDDRTALLKELHNAAGIVVRNRTVVDKQLLDAAPQLKVVGRLGVGLDNIDLDECAARGVVVYPATGANARSVAEYVLGAALVLRRGVYTSTAATLAGEWPRAALSSGGELAGLTLGLYGYGVIARKVASCAQALNMEVVACDPYVAATDPAWGGVRCCTAAELLAVADVLSLHIPLSAETRNLIDEAALARLKPQAIVINTARGGIVDENALCAALSSGKLGGASLDVFAVEPLTAAAGAKFAQVPNLLLTPHIAGLTAEGNIRVSELTIANVVQELQRV